MQGYGYTCIIGMRSTVLILGLALSAGAGPAEHFVPVHRVSGVGVARIDM